MTKVIRKLNELPRSQYYVLCVYDYLFSWGNGKNNNVNVCIFPCSDEIESEDVLNNIKDRPEMKMPIIVSKNPLKSKLPFVIDDGKKPVFHLFSRRENPKFWSPDRPYKW